MAFDLTFHGAAGCVTGSCMLLRTDRASVLVDCGMFQGPKTLKALNYERFPFDPRSIDAVLLTHAHIDHSGMLPKLMRAGFHGPIYATAGTRELCAVMLPDAGDIQESEVRRLNRRNERRGRARVEPIYTVRDAERTLSLFHPAKLGQDIAAAPGIAARFWDAGHMLGSASIQVTVEDAEGPCSILFSGDLGPGGRDFIPDPEGPSGIDHIVMESTYGGRRRPLLDPSARRRLLGQELRDARSAGGPMLIPAFAVERSQELLADLQILMRDGEIPPTDIFLDSPLAIEATEVFRRRGWSPSLARNPFEDLRSEGRLQFLREPWESDRLERLGDWHIVMAASGMCDAGRVRKHLKRLLWQRQATVLIPGFQAAGTLGRLLVDGARNVRIEGEEIHVRARIRPLDIYSGHADQDALVAWAKARRPLAGDIFLDHGEPAELEALQRRLGDEGFPAHRIRTPSLDGRYALAAGAVRTVDAPARLLPGKAACPDWHNARSQLLLDLNARLEAETSDDAREALIAELRRLVSAVGSPGGAKAEAVAAPAGSG